MSFEPSSDPFAYVANQVLGGRVHAVKRRGFVQALVAQRLKDLGKRPLDLVKVDQKPVGVQFSSPERHPHVEVVAVERFHELDRPAESQGMGG